MLLSWAVPKGPSFDPTKMQMAIHVEDHPLDYADLRGHDPAAAVRRRHGHRLGPRHVGAGRRSARGHAQGKLVFTLHGEKLAGLWELVRIAKPGDKQDAWMLFKKKDAWARRTPTTTSSRRCPTASSPSRSARSRCASRAALPGRPTRSPGRICRPPRRRRCRPSSSRSSPPSWPRRRAATGSSRPSSTAIG